MKEYQSKAGGRYIFNEDIENLQELALSMASLFEDCGQDFVISGCEVTKSSNTVSISSGMVWLDGKIRRVAASSGTYQSNIGLHIVAKQTDGPTIKYADGTGGKQYTEFGTQVKIGVALQDGEQAISIGNYTDGKQFPNLRTVFFEYYALTKGAGDAVSLIKLLATGCSLKGVTGNSDTFRDSYTNQQSGVPANTSISGVSINDIPIFTIGELLLAMRKLILNDLFLTGVARIKEAYIETAHIENTMRIVASGSLYKISNDSAYSGSKVIITQTQVHIGGSFTYGEIKKEVYLYDSTQVFIITDIKIPNDLMEIILGRTETGYDQYHYISNTTTVDVSYGFCLRSTLYTPVFGNFASTPNQYNNYASYVNGTVKSDILVFTDGTIAFLINTYGQQYQTVTNRNIKLAASFDLVPVDV